MVCDSRWIRRARLRTSLVTEGHSRGRTWDWQQMESGLSMDHSQQLAPESEARARGKAD